MLSGKQFKILRATLAVELIDERTVVTVPGGSIIRVFSQPTRVNPLVGVYWECRKLEMFAVDVRNRSAKIERAAGA
jgi:hypothetical protein